MPNLQKMFSTSIIMTLRFIRQSHPAECLQYIRLESINVLATYFNSFSELCPFSASGRAAAPVEVIPPEERLQWKMFIQGMTHHKGIFMFLLLWEDCKQSNQSRLHSYWNSYGVYSTISRATTISITTNSCRKLNCKWYYFRFRYLSV